MPYKDLPLETVNQLLKAVLEGPCLPELTTEHKANLLRSLQENPLTVAPSGDYASYGRLEGLAQYPEVRAFITTWLQQEKGEPTIKA
jgi:hypothetical protein